MGKTIKYVSLTIGVSLKLLYALLGRNFSVGISNQKRPLVYVS